MMYVISLKNRTQILISFLLNEFSLIESGHPFVQQQQQQQKEK